MDQFRGEASLEESHLEFVAGLWFSWQFMVLFQRVLSDTFLLRFLSRIVDTRVVAPATPARMYVGTLR